MVEATPADRRRSTDTTETSMDMQKSDTSATGSMQMQEGDDYVCSNCGCEIRVRHVGDPAKMQNMRPFTCCCGTQMAKEEHSA
jgi:hypothetical protein